MNSKWTDPQAHQPRVGWLRSPNVGVRYLREGWVAVDSQQNIALKLTTIAGVTRSNNTQPLRLLPSCQEG